MAGAVIGIIGGSGLDQIDGLRGVEWRRVESPFGRTSEEFCFGTLDGQAVVFVPRHGRGHGSRLYLSVGSGLMGLPETEGGGDGPAGGQ